MIRVGPDEIKRKYSMLMKIKKMVIFLGILSVFTLFGYSILAHYKFEFESVTILILCIISFILFLLLWVSIFPIKKHILQLIDEYEKEY